MLQGFKTTRDEGGLVTVVRLVDNQLDKQLDVVNKLDATFSSKSHVILKAFNEHGCTLASVVAIQRHLTRKKEYQLTYIDNGIKKTKRDYGSGYLVRFIRCFRGRYEIDTSLSRYVVGYCIINKSELLKRNNKTNISSHLTEKAIDDMMNTIDKLNWRQTTIWQSKISMISLLQWLIDI